MVPFAGYDMPIGYDGVGYGRFGLLVLPSGQKTPPMYGGSAMPALVRTPEIFILNTSMGMTDHDPPRIGGVFFHEFMPFHWARRVLFAALGLNP